ncbi:MAG: DsbA family protein [Gemmatimonadaceae bacterium]
MRCDFRSGVESGVNGTPIFFINGERYNGAWTDAEGFIDALNQMAQSGTSSRSAS